MGMGEGNGFRPVHCKGCLLRRLRRRNKQDVFVAVMEQMEFPFVPFVAFRPVSGSPRWFPALDGLPSCAGLRALFTKLKILNLEVLEFCEFCGFTTTRSVASSTAAQGKVTKNHKRHSFVFVISPFSRSPRFVSAVLWILRSSGRHSRAAARLCITRRSA